MLKKILLVLGIVIVLLLATVTLFVFSVSPQSITEIFTGFFRPDDELAFKETVERVGNLIPLPKDETPALLTITNIEELELEDRIFFAKAKNGDKVLIYTREKLIIVYRPSENRIINVGEDLLDPPPIPSARIGIIF